VNRRITEVRQAPDPEILEAADDGRLVDLAMYRALLNPALEKNKQRYEQDVDAVARERALRWVDELHEKVAEAELVLATLGGFVDEHSLGSAAVNSTAIKLGEAREHLPVLRQAVRDMEQGS
jgi:hypothetical protein